MLIINVSARIVNEQVPANNLAAQFESFKFGYDLFSAREPMSRCMNSQQERGWMAALRSEAAATLPANCADRLGF